jgi:hypothetical protein
LLACCAALGGCFFGRAPTAYELDPLDSASAPREPLPDESERLSAQLLAWSLSGGGDPAVPRALLERIQQIEAERKAGGQSGTGLLDNALDAFNSAAGEQEFQRFAVEMLQKGTSDPALERKLRSYLDSQPLRIAERRLSEDRRRRYGQVFNRLVAPIPRAIAGDPTVPLEAGRALIYSYSVLRSVSQASTAERQALRAYSEFLQSNPGSPGAAGVASQVQRLSQKLREQRLREALKAARDSLAAGRPDAALIHLARAEQTAPEDGRTLGLRKRAEEELFQQEQRVRTTLLADPGGDLAFASFSGGSKEPLAADLLERPLTQLDELGGDWQRIDADLTDELAFVKAAGRLYSGDEDGYFSALQKLSERPGNMARHAQSALRSPEQNPYAVYLNQRSARRGQLTRYLLLGPLASGLPRNPTLPLPLRALNFVFELPSYIVVPIVGFPFRLIQYPSVKPRLDGPVIDAGELYLGRFPKGEHAQEIHRSLEDAYADRGQWSKALEHHQARRDARPAQVKRYREQVAKRTLEYASLDDRPLDVRMSVYASLVREYGDTKAGQEAGRQIEELRKKLTPQSIRLTREFLLENREVWGPGALGLRPELLDGEGDHGEVAEGGVRLIGKNFVEIELDAREPIQGRIPEENFVRFVSLLEEARYRRMAGDGRERPAADPQLDSFLERARLGLLDDPELRPTARSESVMMSSSEKFGMKRESSILPIELVVRGGLSDAGLAALPRIKIPEESEDAFLYK